MMAERLAVSLLTTLLLFQAGPLVAQESSDSEDALQGIDRSLKKIVELLQAQAQQQRVSLLLDRLRMESDGLVRLEASLRPLASERDGLLAQLTTLQAKIEAEEDRIFRESVNLSTDETDARMRQELNLAYIEVKKQEETLAAKERAITEIENEIGVKRLEYQKLKSMVDDALGVNG